ncbi:hypothetical protein CPB84DRAFT_1417423 [Gymnopilus junonius]|uniref:Uncharacterized protein n=1 Tax=Gymnopilus junonius TaxID=109634 RepID=A0A9P5NJZ4_GYMJU|nr:hypothetical protein CPB84DRAFT_1417423 [Gymnopilus junonius]
MSCPLPSPIQACMFSWRNLFQSIKRACKFVDASDTNIQGSVTTLHIVKISRYKEQKTEMKLQLNILVTLAIFYGSAVAAPVPTNAVADDSISDDVLGTLGKLIGEAWAGAVPNNVLQASAQGAGVHLNHNRRDLAEVDDSISDDVLSALGKLIGTAWSNVVPASALQGSAQGLVLISTTTAEMWRRSMTASLMTFSTPLGSSLEEDLALLCPTLPFKEPPRALVLISTTTAEIWQRSTTASLTMSSALLEN